MSESASRMQARVPCTRETRDEILRPLKRGGQTFDDLLRQMADQYDPEEATDK